LNIMIIGGGGREHALAWKIAQSPRVGKIYVAPGNAGTALIAENVDLNATDIEGLGKAAVDKGIDLAVVGPELPLASGIVDHFDNLAIPTFGPTKAAARLESSKVFARELMERNGIPCPKGAVFSSYLEAREYVRQQQPPIVVKADGLAAGKGTVIANSVREADEALTEIMDAKAFGSAGDKVIIDEWVTGQEVSLIAFTDSQIVSPMVPACDYKKIWDGDQGPNTGGMGSYSPPRFFSAEFVEKATNSVLLPAVRAMAREGTPYKGVIYAGLMVTDSELLALEFNARFGDPETQVILPLLSTDLVEILLAVIQGKLEQLTMEWTANACVGVVMASAGYPGKYETGYPIKGFDNLDEDLLVFHAGTRLGDDGQVRTNGGRVLTLVSVGKDMAEARARVYRNLPSIRFEGCHYRRDIALREIS
jgi:phosphoribosylamine--glycine ligase